jgi:Polysaccharide lyase
MGRVMFFAARSRRLLKAAGLVALAALLLVLQTGVSASAQTASVSAAKKCTKAKGKAKKHARKKRRRCRSDRSAGAATPNKTSNLPFLQGLTERWSDDASVANPVESGRWDLYSCQRKDGLQSSSTIASELVSNRFSTFSSGGPGNKPYYHFYAPQGDNVWTPGSAGRCELSYPVGDPGNAPPHAGPPGAYMFYEGRRAVTMFSVRLPSGWDVNAPSWRVIAQWKQNEWVDTGGISPALALEQRSGNWIMTNFGGPIIWSMPATAGGWINFAFDITYSGNASNGRVKVYADTNNDGTYEYSSSTWSGRTLFQQNGTGVESAYINGLYEGVGGDSLDKADFSIWN